MENNKQFTITYYADKHKKHITRLGKWLMVADIGQINLVKQFLHIGIWTQIILEMRQYLGKWGFNADN